MQIVRTKLWVSFNSTIRRTISSRDVVEKYRKTNWVTKVFITAGHSEWVSRVSPKKVTFIFLEWNPDHSGDDSKNRWSRDNDESTHVLPYFTVSVIEDLVRSSEWLVMQYHTQIVAESSRNCIAVFCPISIYRQCAFIVPELRSKTRRLIWAEFKLTWRANIFSITRHEAEKTVLDSLMHWC